MKREEFIEYFSILRDLYKKNDISIEWFKNNFRFSSKLNLEEYLEEYALSIEQFRETVLETVTLIRDIATGENLEGYEDWKIALIKEDFLTDDDFAHINVISTSNVKTISGINQEILTKRCSSDIHKVNTYSVLISLETRDNTGELINFELSKKQLIKLIDNLENSLSAIEALENKT